jgi:hypothetical protein
LSRAEAILARRVAGLLSRIPTGADFTEQASADVELCSALEVYASEALARRHAGWTWEGLDGVWPVRAIKTEANTAELVGGACLVGDQSMTPFFAALRVSAPGAAIASYDIRVGEPGQGHLGISVAPFGSARAYKMMVGLAARLGSVNWVYRASGEEGGT